MLIYELPAHGALCCRTRIFWPKKKVTIQGIRGVAVGMEGALNSYVS